MIIMMIQFQQKMFNKFNKVLITLLMIALMHQILMQYIFKNKFLII